MDIPFILWIVTFTLFCIVIVQVFYLIFLSYIPTRRSQRRAEPIAASSNRQAGAAPLQSSSPLTGTSGQNPSSIATPVPAAMTRTPSAQPQNLRTTTMPAAVAAPVAAAAPSFSGQATAGSALISEVGKLVVLSGLSDQMEINLPSAEFGIGRFYNQERKVLVVLDEKSISREHAFFQYNAQLGQYSLTDKSSSYGTYILAKDKFDPLTPEQPLQLFNGDVVQFGNLVKVRFILAGSTRASVTQL